MAYQRSDPRVKAWMKEHADIVEEIEQRRSELYEMSLEQLTVLALDCHVDVSSAMSKLVGKLVEGIIAAERKP